MMGIYDFTLLLPNGENYPLSKLQGKVILIVNTATRCGFTREYDQLEELYKKYHEQGLEIIDIPCNQFGNQAPESDQEIASFCKLNFNTTFPRMKKSEVNGPNALPLYSFLVEKKPWRERYRNGGATMLDKMLAQWDDSYYQRQDIKWNFTTFLIARDGEVAIRFEPTDELDVMAPEIEKLL